MTIRKYSLLTALASLTLSTAVSAASPKGTPQYDWVELRLVTIEDGSAEGDGLNIGGSYQVNEKFYFTGSYEDNDFDTFETQAISLGGGFIHQYESNIDIFAELSYISVDLESPDDDGDTFEENQSGYVVGAGAKAHVGSGFEVRASVNMEDVSDRDTYIHAGFEYFVMEELSVGASINLLGEADRITFGARFHFR